MACPLMHMLMHGGHGGHVGHHDGGIRTRDGNRGSSGARLEDSLDGADGPKGESHSHHGGRPSATRHLRVGFGRW
jgi:hypothetical protein